MRLLVPVVAALSAGSLSTSSSGLPHRPAIFRVAIDVTGANAVLAAALASPTDAADAADAALRNAAVRAMIDKMGKYDPTVTAAAFKAAVVALANGASGGLFDLERLRADPAPTRRMLARLTNDSAAIARRVAERLQSFTPDGLDIHATLFVLVGAKHQNGWVPDQTLPNFYVDLGFHGEEVESLINVASHELYHVVHGMAQPSFDSAFADRPDLPAEARERHRAHAVLLNLADEGMATYVGDATIYPSTGPHLEHDKLELQRELARAGEIFTLFDTILYRTRHDPDAPLGPLLRIGFGGPWDQTGYYVGYRMAKTIDRYSGRNRLRALTGLPPEDLVIDYVTLARAHPDDPEITPLAPSSIATVEELARLGSQRP